MGQISNVLSLMLYTQLILVLFVAIGFAGPLRRLSPISGVCAAFFFTYAAALFDRLYVMREWYATAPHLTEFFTAFELLFPPLLYLLVLASTRAQRGSLCLYLKHAMPFLLGLLLRLPIFLLSGEDKIVWESGDLVAHKMLPTWHVSLVDFSNAMIDLLYLVCITGYLVMSIRVLRKHRGNLHDVLSDTEGKSLRWLVWFVGLFAMLWFFLAVFYEPAELGDTQALILGTTETVIILALAYCALIQAPVYTANEASVLADLIPAKSTKYAKSALTDADIERIAARLEACMAEQLLYLEPNLTLPALAAQLGVSTNYLSQVINAKFDSRFHDFVNRYRVEAAADRLITQRDTAILDVAMSCGFNSKSTFNAAFKNVFDVTPSEYRRSQQRA